MAGHHGKDPMRDKAEAFFKKHMKAEKKEGKELRKMSKTLSSKKARCYAEGGEMMQAPFAPSAEKDMRLSPASSVMAKKGGCVKKAIGGVAKIRHKQATKSGAPLNKKALKRM